MQYNKLLLIIVFCSTMFGGPAECWLERTNAGEQIAVGDTINLSIQMSTHSDSIVGYDIYLAFDPLIFESLSEDGDPFIPYNYGYPESSWIIFSNYTSDGEMDYAAFKNPQSEDFIVGDNKIASFNLLVLNIPSGNDASTSIQFDRGTARTSQYINLEGEEQFSETTGLTLTVEGYAIYPVIPDTVVYPGTNLILDLDNYFDSNVYDETLANWTIDVTQSVDEVEVFIDGSSNELNVIAPNGSKGILNSIITLNISGQSLFFTQFLEIEINYPVHFVDPIPNIIFYEDSVFFIHYDSLFIDQDDSSEELTVWDTLVTLNTPILTDFSDNDSIKFSLSPNYYGLANTRLFVSEPIGRTIDTILVINILNINDPPAIDFSGISGDPALGDTIVLYHGVSKAIQLDPYIEDIDDNVFSWSFEPNPLLDIDSLLIEENVLEMIPVNDTLVNTQLIIFASDGDTTIGEPINIKIRSNPPEILSSGALIINADTTYFLQMDTVVTDPDTPMEQLLWDFTFLADGDIDPNVIFDFNLDSLMLTINSNHSENSTGTIAITVQENFIYGNTVSLEIPVVYFASFAPQILSVSPIIVSPDTVIEILDMDSLVFDYNDTPENISWSVLDFSNFEDVYIDSISHVLTIQTKSDFFGDDTLTLIAMNLSLLSDTADIYIKVIPYDPFPQISQIPDQTTYWNSQSVYLFDLDDYIFDITTPGQSIEWSLVYNSDTADVFIDENHEVFVTSNELTGLFSVIFSANNLINYSSSDTIYILIEQDAPPEWETLISLTMSKFLPELELGYRLTENCSDDLTISDDLIFDVETDTSVLLAEINSFSEVTLTLLDTSKESTTFSFSAEDEHSNTSISNVVNIFIVNGFSPQWSDIPTISFGNTNSLYISECLEDWVEDLDTPDALLSFIVESVDPDLEASIDSTDSSCSLLYLSPLSDIHGNFFIILRSEDEQGNESSKLVQVWIYESDPPELNLSYFISPLLSSRMHYVLTSDGSVFNPLEVPNSFYLEDSLIGSLNFSYIDGEENLDVWRASYQFQESGLYKLKVSLADESDNISEDSLALTISLPDQGAGSLRSPSGKIVMEYSNKIFSTEDMLILKENHLSNDLEINEELKSYSIESVSNVQTAFITSFDGENIDSDYFAFYQILNGRGVQIPTFLNKSGDFLASIPLNSNFYFGTSSVAAKNVAIPQNDAYCYPNPFNSTINILFFIPIENEVSFSAYNMLGQLVFSDQRTVKPGLVSMEWDGRGSSGYLLPSGLYFFHISGESVNILKKITMLK